MKTHSRQFFFQMIFIHIPHKQKQIKNYKQQGETAKWKKMSENIKLIIL
jgi:hypothetical protein